MDDKAILSKTAKGREEIETRKYKLDQRLRSVLIVVNGKLTALDPAARLTPARTELAALIAASLGPAGDDIAMKIEGAKTIEELRAYLESRRAVLDGALGKAKAAAFWARAAALTG